LSEGSEAKMPMLLLFWFVCKDLKKFNRPVCVSAMESFKGLGQNVVKHASPAQVTLAEIESADLFSRYICRTADFERKIYAD
jgi:hypothetical protein